MKVSKRVKLSKHDKKNIIVLLQGRLVSELFSNIYSFGVSLFILDFTGKGFAFAISLSISTLPKILFSFFAGAISDKWDRKKMIVFSDLLSGTVLVLYIILLNTINLNVLISIYVLSFILSTIYVFFSISISSVIPQLVDVENISRVNGMSQIVSSISSILGPTIGGILYNIIDFKYFVLLNAISFILSGILEIFLKVRKIKRTVDSNDIGKENSLNECINFLNDTQGLSLLMLTSAVMNFFLAVGFTVPMPYIVNNVFRMSSSEYGILKSALVIGALLGSIILSIFPLKDKITDRYIQSSIIIGIIYFIFSLLSIPYNYLNFSIRKNIFFILFILISFFMIFINIPLKTILQQNIPEHIRGKVLGLLNIILSIASPIANLLAGLLVDNIEAFYLPLVSGIIIILLGFSVNFNKRIKMFQALSEE